MLKMKQTTQWWQLCSLDCFVHDRNVAVAQAGHHRWGITALHSSVWKGHMTIWPHFRKLSSMQSLFLIVVPFLTAEDRHLNPHICPTQVFFKGFKFSPQCLLCMKSFSSDNSRIFCKRFYCNSSGHSIGSIQKDAARWTGAVGRVEFSPSHASPRCALPSFLLLCLLGAAPSLWVKRKLQPHYGGQQHESTVRGALVTMNKQWNAFFLKLLIPLGISEPSVGNIHLVKQWCHLWH